MPEAYESIKESLKKAHPNWSEQKVKEMASRTFIARGGKAGSKGRHERAKQLAKDRKS